MKREIINWIKSNEDQAYRYDEETFVVSAQDLIDFIESLKEGKK